MTIDQFRNHGWTPGQSCDYGGTIYKIASVDFAENLVGLENPLSDEGITWVRCENIILHNIFATHLAECGNALQLHGAPAESPIIERARTYIKDHSDDELSLVAVAKIVNMSATYFSVKFKEAVGLNFVDYVARTRIEKARCLLLDPTRRVSEVAFEVGFQSLSQFNRTFKKIVGESPRDYRANLPLAGV